MVLRIKHSIKYKCSTHLKLTNTQREKLTSFDRWAENIIDKSFNVNTENVIRKHAVKTLKKCINTEICENFRNYSEVNDHNKGTRNQTFLMQVSKSYA